MDQDLLVRQVFPGLHGSLELTRAVLVYQVKQDLCRKPALFWLTIVVAAFLDGHELIAINN